MFLELTLTQVWCFQFCLWRWNQAVCALTAGVTTGLLPPAPTESRLGGWTVSEELTRIPTAIFSSRRAWGWQKLVTMLWAPRTALGTSQGGMGTTPKTLPPTFQYAPLGTLSESKTYSMPWRCLPHLTGQATGLGQGPVPLRSHQTGTCVPQASQMSILGTQYALRALYCFFAKIYF